MHLKPKVISARVIATVTAGLLVLAATGCLRDGADERPNVLLITVDTLRADHLGAYGYKFDTSPNIDRLAAGGAVVERCVSAAPETAPGTASLLTGLYQDAHTVAYNLRTLPEDVTTLAEYLSAAGYRTAAFVGNFLVGPKFGFGQGFERIETFEGPISVAPRDEIGNAAALAWLEEHHRGGVERNDQPWFLWIHYMDPHGPYTPADTTWSDALTYDRAQFADDSELPRGDSNFGLGVLPRYQRVRGFSRPSQYVRRYDGEIRATDAVIGSLLETLSRLGEHDSTLVVLTADHGESLTEHQEFFQHGWFLYDTTLHVPLVFRLPGAIPAGTRVAGQASGVDLVPSVLDLVSIDLEGDSLDGRSLASALTDAKALPAHPAFAYGPRDNRPFAVSHDGYKFILTPAGAPETQGSPKRDEVAERLELYRIDNDPAETQELGPDHPKFSQLHSMLLEYMRSFHRRLWKRGRELQAQHRDGE